MKTLRLLSLGLLCSVAWADIPLQGAITPNGPFPVVNAGNQKITNLADPTVSTDAATKNYVDVASATDTGIFAKLLGRAGGQTINGGTLTGNTLSLGSNPTDIAAGPTTTPINFLSSIFAPFNANGSFAIFTDNANATGVPGMSMNISTGTGFAASGVTAGTRGGNFTFFTGAGGPGTATLASGKSGQLRFQTNGAGAANGGPGNVAGDIIFAVGPSTNGGTAVIRLGDGTGGFIPSPVNVSAAGFNTAVGGTLSVAQTATFTGLIGAEGGLDRTSSATLSIGTTNATQINVGKPTVLLDAKGDFQVDGVQHQTTFSGAVYADFGGVDRSSSATLSLGTNNASAVAIASSGATTTIAGPLTANQTATFGVNANPSSNGGGSLGVTGTRWGAGFIQTLTTGTGSLIFDNNIRPSANTTFNIYKADNATSVVAFNTSTSAVTFAGDVAAATFNGHSLPSGGALVVADATQTLTNKTISGASNTLSNIANGSLVNSSITINSTPVSLGGSINITSGINQLTGDVTAGPGSGSQAATLALSGVTAATYGDASHTNQTTYDAKGRAVSASSVAIQIAEGAVTNLVSDLAAKATDSLAAHLAGTETFTGAKTFSGALKSTSIASQTAGQSLIYADSNSTSLQVGSLNSTSTQVFGSTVQLGSLNIPHGNVAIQTGQTGLGGAGSFTVLNRDGVNAINVDSGTGDTHIDASSGSIAWLGNGSEAVSVLHATVAQLGLSNDSTSHVVVNENTSVDIEAQTSMALRTLSGDLAVTPDSSHAAPITSAKTLYLYTCTTTEAVRDAVYISAANTAVQASASSSATGPIIGFVYSKPTTTSCLVQTTGQMGGFSALTAGALYYAGTTAGTITSTAPAAANFQQTVGVAVNSTTLQIKSSATFERIGGSFGTATLAGGTVTVTNANCKTSSVVILTYQGNGLSNLGFLDVAPANGSFTITSSNVLDSNVVGYDVLN